MAAACLTVGAPGSSGGTSQVTVSRVGGVHALHSADRGRAVFADVMLVGDDRVIATYQLAGADAFCEGKSLYFQELDRNLTPTRGETRAIDVTEVGSIFRPNETVPGDLGDHKFTVHGEQIIMLTTVPGEPEARLVRFDTHFTPIDDLTDDGSLARVGDETQEDRLLDMGFGSDGTNLYAQFYNQPEGSSPSDWGAQLYRLDAGLNTVAEAVVHPESGIFLTGTSVVYVPRGQMGATEDRLQSFSPDTEPRADEPSGIHTFAVTADDLTLIPGSTQTIATSSLDLYFPTGADWNETHQIWVVGYTQELVDGVHGSVLSNADPCRGTAQPPGEVYRELGPSFISIYDPNWVELQTIQLNDGEDAFRVMVETAGDDIYVAYDEMDKYAWRETSQAKLEHYRITRAE